MRETGRRVSSTRRYLWILALAAACGIGVAVWLAKQRLAAPSGPAEKIAIAGLRAVSPESVKIIH